MRAFVKTEMDKLRKMSFKDKRWYIWEYYRVHLFTFAAIVLLSAMLINSLVNPRPSTYLYIAWFEVEADFLQLHELQKALDVIVENPERHEVLITDYTNMNDRRQNSGLQARFLALHKMNAIDALITTRQGAEGLISENFLIRPADEVLGLLPSIDEERLIWADSSVWAISLAGSPLMERLYIDTSDVYLCVILNTERIYEIARAVEVLINGA
ncbi:MAG: hypothetical protein FWG87_09335 [Defluviitaleaceae bacterium]|nr:hypothetical protein [Defluviitaleaceae bacterium]